MLSFIRRLQRAWVEPRPVRRPSRRLGLETLEVRAVMSSTNVLQTNLVSDLPGVAAVTDPNLINPWGISESGGSAFWISDNNAGLTTLYDTNAQGTTVNDPGLPLVGIPGVPVPGQAAPTQPSDPNGQGGTPTGTVFNGTSGFLLTPPADSKATKPGKAIFLFATEGGDIAGWNPGIFGTEGVVAVNNNTNPTATGGAVYKGLAITSTAAPVVATDAASNNLLYAANFRAGTVDVFDGNFQQINSSLAAGAFTDPNLPKGFAPFNVQELSVGGVTKIFVTYAKQDLSKHDDVAGAGNGFVDVYNTDGTGMQRLVSRGALDSPWGLAIAPSSFGSLAGALLVGNFGNGQINAYNATTGASLGQLLDGDGKPLQIPGLWALQPGNGGLGGLKGDLYFTAGIGGELHGLFGSLAPVAAGTSVGPALLATDAEMVQANLQIFTQASATLQSDIAAGAPDFVIKQDVKVFNQDEAALLQSQKLLATETLDQLGLSKHDGAGSGGKHSGEGDDFGRDH